MDPEYIPPPLNLGSVVTDGTDGISGLKVTMTRSFSRKNEPYIGLYQDIEIPDGYLSDVMEPYIDSWKPSSPVMLDVTMGSGKTTLIPKCLLPRAQAAGGKVLVLSNRVPLALSHKRKIMASLDLPYDPEDVPDAMLAGMYDFDPVYIMTYQKVRSVLHSDKDQPWLDKVMYVCLDEAAYFCDDAGFSSNVDKELSDLVKRFKNAVRIYMTATPEIVRNALAKYEAPIIRPLLSLLPGQSRAGCGKFLHYWRPSNYDFSYVHLHFIHGLKDLIPTISENSRRKFLVFVDSKPKGQAFAELLGDKAVYIDAENKAESKACKKLIKDSSFDAQVMVCTSILYNGVDFWMDDLRDIVVMSTNPVQLKQMLGRKRRHPGMTVNLWVITPSKASVNSRYRDCADILDYYKQLDAVQKYADQFPREARRSGKMAKLASRLWNDPRHRDILQNYFNISSGSVYPRFLAREALEYQFYNVLLPLKNGFSFEEMVRGWLHKDAPDINARDEFYDLHSSDLLDAEAQNQLRDIIVRSWLDSGHTEPQPSRVKTLGIDALNNRLRNMLSAYQIEKLSRPDEDGKATILWKLVRTDQAKNKETD